MIKKPLIIRVCKLFSAIMQIKVFEQAQFNKLYVIIYYNYLHYDYYRHIDSISLFYASNSLI